MKFKLEMEEYQKAFVNYKGISNSCNEKYNGPNTSQILLQSNYVEPLTYSKYNRRKGNKWLNIQKCDDEENREETQNFQIYNLNKKYLNDKKGETINEPKIKRDVHTLFKEKDGSISFQMVKESQNIDVTKFIKKVKLPIEMIQNENSISENFANLLSIEKFPIEINTYLKFPNYLKVKYGRSKNDYQSIYLEFTYFDKYNSLNQFGHKKTKKNI